MIFNWIRRITWKPKGKIYSLKCNQCGEGFLYKRNMDAPICGRCIQEIKSSNSTINHEKSCIICGKKGVIKSSEKCNECYFKKPVDE